MILKKCTSCCALIEVLDDCKCQDCSIICCNEPMKEVRCNSTDGAVEKHKPEYTIEDGMITVFVNHVMEEEHYIEWIKVETDKESHKYKFKPGDEAKITLPYQENMRLYAYCNKHGLWETVVE